ncbi:hypothetical protein ACNKHO_15215 [Shigella flexneri]
MTQKARLVALGRRSRQRVKKENRPGDCRGKRAGYELAKAETGIEVMMKRK